MSSDRASKCIKPAYEIGSNYNALTDSVCKARKVFGRVAAEDATYCLEGVTYSLAYAPAITPIKNAFEAYDRVFPLFQGYFASFVNKLAEELRDDILSPSGAQVSEMSRIDVVRDDSEKVKTYAAAISAALETILERTAMGVDVKGNRTKTPAEIKAFIEENEKTVELYASGTEAHGSFNDLRECLDKLDVFYKRLTVATSPLKTLFPDGVSDANLAVGLTALKKVSDELNELTADKKGDENAMSEILKKAEGLMSALRADIQAAMTQRTALISKAFERIAETVPPAQSGAIIAVRRGDDGLAARRLTPEEETQLLASPGVATMTISSICAVRHKDRDCKGQFAVHMLIANYVVSADTKKLFVVDDGYSGLQLPEWERIDAEDFSKAAVKDEDPVVYFSAAAYAQLKRLTKTPIIEGK